MRKWRKITEMIFYTYKEDNQNPVFEGLINIHFIDYIF